AEPINNRPRFHLFDSYSTRTAFCKLGVAVAEIIIDTNRADLLDLMRDMRQASEAERNLKRVVISPIEVLVNAKTFRLEQSCREPMMGAAEPDDRLVRIAPIIGGLGRRRSFVAATIFCRIGCSIDTRENLKHGGAQFYNLCNID